jgi:galactoside 2-L-fucosyltransferase 1/2
MSIVEYSAFQYDQRLEKLSTMSLGDVTVIGFFQSWKYFRDVATRVRSEFQFRSEVQKGATDFLRDISAKHSLLACDTLYIGVHIRRGDMLASYNTQKGYTVADDAYLRRAVSYFTHRFAAGKRLVYVVCSDDLPWAEAHFVDAVAAVWNDTVAGVNNASGLLTWLKSAVSGLVVARNGETRDLFFAGCNHSSVSAPRNTASLSPDFNISSPARVSTINTTSSNANSGSLTSAAASAGASNAPVVVMSREHTTEQDLAILSACNHTIMTVGTYGWWAGYLAGGTTVYLRNFPAARSELDRWFSRDDFFPPDWIGL